MLLNNIDIYDTKPPQNALLAERLLRNDILQFQLSTFQVHIQHRSWAAHLKMCTRHDCSSMKETTTLTIRTHNISTTKQNTTKHVQIVLDIMHQGVFQRCVFFGVILDDMKVAAPVCELQ